MLLKVKKGINTIMKFYSEVTKQLYNTEKELIEAETKIKNAEAEKLAAEKAKRDIRASRAKEVEKALKEANEAQTKAIKLVNDFTKDYGFFHMSFPNKNKSENSEDFSAADNFLNLLNTFLK